MRCSQTKKEPKRPKKQKKVESFVTSIFSNNDIDDNSYMSPILFSTTTTSLSSPLPPLNCVSSAPICQPNLLLSYKYKILSSNKNISIGFNSEAIDFDASFVMDDGATFILFSSDDWFTLLGSLERIIREVNLSEERIYNAHNQLALYMDGVNPFIDRYTISDSILFRIISTGTGGDFVYKNDDDDDDDGEELEKSIKMSKEELRNLHQWMLFLNTIMMHYKNVSMMVYTYFNNYIRKCREMDRVLAEPGEYFNVELPGWNNNNYFPQGASLPLNFFRLFNEFYLLCDERIKSLLSQQ